jgi:hypothetical protein
MLKLIVLVLPTVPLTSACSCVLSDETASVPFEISIASRSDNVESEVVSSAVVLTVSVARSWRSSSSSTCSLFRFRRSQFEAREWRFMARLPPRCSTGLTQIITLIHISIYKGQRRGIMDGLALRYRRCRTDSPSCRRLSLVEAIDFSTGVFALRGIEVTGCEQFSRNERSPARGRLAGLRPGTLIDVAISGHRMMSSCRLRRSPGLQCTANSSVGSSNRP